jgi:predicted RNase H-like nuclease
MDAILGIDAAWTKNQPSGVALAQSTALGWQCIAIAPSYDTFIALSRGIPVDWNAPSIPGGVPPVAKLLEATARLTRAPLSVVEIDMPVATVPITGRRAADNMISKTFGNRGCSTHSPGIDRPGDLGAILSREFQSLGYTIATASDPSGTVDRLIEVYPHPALLSLLRRNRRVPYKVSKARKYWPALPASERKKAILNALHEIRDGLKAEMDVFELPLPPLNTVTTQRMLKRFEDALDAVICAWVGTRYIGKKALAFGDSTAAIWCPDQHHHTH